MMFSNETKSVCDLNKNYDTTSLPETSGNNETEIDLEKSQCDEARPLVNEKKKSKIYNPVVVFSKKNGGDNLDQIQSLTDIDTSLAHGNSKKYEQTQLLIQKEKRYLKRKTLFALIILCLLNLLNYIDRYIVGSVLIDVQDYFGVNKSTAGLLQTIFLLSFTLAAPFVGYIGDRYKRKYLIVGGCSIWFVSVLGGSFIGPNDFVIFALLRCSFGVASAFYECVSLPIISDLYKVETAGSSRTRALFLFYLGPPLGVGLGFLIANTIRDILPNDWRFTMRFTPGFVLFLAILVLVWFHEPERSKSQKGELAAIKRRSATHELVSNKTYILIIFSSSCAVCTLVGFNWWSPTYISYMLASESKTEVQIFERKQIYSIVQTISGALGTLFPSEMSTWLKRKINANNSWKAAIDCYLLTAEMFATSLSLYVYILLSSLYPSLDMIFYAIFTFFINSWRILIANILLDIVDAKYRAISNSILLFVLHLLGDSFAPYWIGAINDECFGSVSIDSVNNQLYCTQLSLYPLVIISFMSSSFALFSTLTFDNDKID
jgi:MFS family permease